MDAGFATSYVPRQAALRASHSHRPLCSQEGDQVLPVLSERWHVHVGELLTQQKEGETTVDRWSLLRALAADG